MSLKELCAATNVSKPKVIDLYRKLDYEVYKEFRQGIQDFYAYHINAYRASCTTFKQIETLEELVQTAREADIASLRRLSEHISTDEFAFLAQAIIDAPTTYVYGPSTGWYPAHYLYQRLKRYRIDVRMVGNDVQHLMEEIFSVGRSDVLLVFDYFLEHDLTQRVMEYARDQGTRVIVVSDTVLVDFVELVERTYFVERGSMGFKNSMAVPMHFVNLLILTIELIGGQRYQDNLRQVEVNRKEYGL